MKFARRKASVDRPDGPARTSAPTGPPPAAGSTVHAALPDGRTLWLAVTAPTGPGARTARLVLRGAASGAEVELPVDPRPDQPGLASTRVDLSLLLPDEEAAYDVLLDDVPVRCGPLAAPPAHPDADPTHRLLLTGDGTLQVRREAGVATLALRHVGLGEDGLTLMVDDTTGPARLALLADDDTEVASYELVAGRCVVAPAALTGLAAQATRVVAGHPGAWRPVSRRGNSLPDPGRGAPLPELVGETADAGGTRLRLRWSPRGLLQARVLVGAGDDA